VAFPAADVCDGTLQRLNEIACVVKHGKRALEITLLVEGSF
jgi:hypothetical protein